MALMAVIVICFFIRKHCSSLCGGTRLARGAGIEGANVVHGSLVAVSLSLPKLKDQTK